jgi:hypothetical protein
VPRVCVTESYHHGQAGKSEAETGGLGVHLEEVSLALAAGIGLACVIVAVDLGLIG